MLSKNLFKEYLDLLISLYVVFRKSCPKTTHKRHMLWVTKHSDFGLWGRRSPSPAHPVPPSQWCLSCHVLVGNNTNTVHLTGYWSSITMIYPKLVTVSFLCTQVWKSKLISTIHFKHDINKILNEFMQITQLTSKENVTYEH